MNALVNRKSWKSGKDRNLLKKLPIHPNKFTLNTVFQCYKGTIQSDSFNLLTVSESTIYFKNHLFQTILKNNKVSKTAGLDNLSGRFLKDGAKFLDKHTTELCNLAISQSLNQGNFLTHVK